MDSLVFKLLHVLKQKDFHIVLLHKHSLEKVNIYQYCLYIVVEMDSLSYHGSPGLNIKDCPITRG